MAPPPDKSVGAAVVLTVLFGPFGLFYSSVVGGLVMLAVDVIIFLISVATLGVGGLLFLFTWPATVIWGAVSASNTHREFEMWKLRMMMSAR